MGVWDSSCDFRLLFHGAAALKGGAGPQPSGPQMERGGLAAALATDWGLLLSAQVGPGGIQCMKCPGMRALCLPPSGGLRLINPHRVGGKLGSNTHPGSGKLEEGVSPGGRKGVGRVFGGRIFTQLSADRKQRPEPPAFLSTFLDMRGSPSVKWG